jgi:hypothetical protein
MWGRLLRAHDPPATTTGVAAEGEDAMTATTYAAPASAETEPHQRPLRNALLTLTVVVLLVLSFAIGRWTSTDASPTQPATTSVQATPHVPCNPGLPC